jgi:hypothetical protein
MTDQTTEAQDQACPHLNFKAGVTVARLTDGDDGPITNYSASIKVRCANKPCGQEFEWIGPPMGVNPGRPTVSVDGTELRAPLRPVGSDPDFGLSGPGHSVRVLT